MNNRGYKHSQGTLPFGVSAAPSIFQRTVETPLQGLMGVCIYLDSILITGKTDQEHLNNLSAVLQRLSAAGMKLKPMHLLSSTLRRFFL